MPPSLNDSAIGGVISCTSTPIQPRVTVPFLTIWSSTIFAVDTGMAKPMPIEPPEREKIAVLMPIRLPAGVDQRAAGVAGVDRGVGLDEVLEGVDAEAGAAERRDDAAGHRLADAEGIADREHHVADAQRSRRSRR